MAVMDKTKRSRVTDHLRERIASMRPGDRLPPERQLATEEKVSRPTMRLVLEQLRSEGLLLSVKGRTGGWEVRSYDPLVTLLSSMERGKRRDNRTLALDDWAAGVREQDRTPRQTVDVQPDAVATAAIVENLPERIGLRVAVGDRVVLRHRKRWVDDRPVQIVDSWFPSWVADTEMLDGSGRRPLLEAPPETKGDVVLPEGILFAIGHRQVRASDRITAKVAELGVRSSLDLSPGTVVLVHTRVGYDASGRPVRLMVTTAPTDRNVLGYEMDL